MSFLSKLFHKSDKKPEKETYLPPDGDNILPKPQNDFLPSAPPPSNASASDTRSAFQNGGMAVGALEASSSPGGADPTMGMVEGLVAGNIISQHIQQHKKHEYWRDQEASFQAGDKDAVLAAPTEGGRDRSRNRDGRDERRKKRWERRAKRKGDGAAVAGDESESGSEEEKK